MSPRTLIELIFLSTYASLNFDVVLYCFYISAEMQYHNHINTHRSM